MDPYVALYWILFWALCAGLGLLALAALTSTTPGGRAYLVSRNRWAGYGLVVVGALVLFLIAAYAMLAAPGCDGRLGQAITCTSIPANAGQVVADSALLVLLALSTIGWPCLACYAVGEGVTRLRSRRKS